MNNAKHTPGPWRAVDRRPVSGNWASRIPFAIERVVGNAVSPVANAHLIAAAPALLEALGAAQEWMSPLSVNLAARTNGLDEVLAQVNAAISAAKEPK